MIKLTNSGDSKKKTFLQPKIKLKGIKKRQELDDITVPIEEHFILRLPESLAQSDSFKEAVKSRQITEQLKIEWSDDRNAVLSVLNQSFPGALVDLPCIIETHKTLDSKQFYKIADISQMLVVGEGSAEEAKSNQWPHGLTPPLKFVRKRRFRKRVSKKAIEDVEREVERLLKADALADDVEFEVYDQRDYEENYLQTEELDQEEEEEDFFDAELDAQIEEALGAEDEDEEEEEGDEDQESTSEEEQEDEEAEEEEIPDEKLAIKQQMTALAEEIKELEALIEEKKQVANKQTNLILKARFENIIDTLNSELKLKKKQMENLVKND